MVAQIKVAPRPVGVLRLCKNLREKKSGRRHEASELSFYLKIGRLQCSGPLVRVLSLACFSPNSRSSDFDVGAGVIERQRGESYELLNGPLFANGPLGVGSKLEIASRISRSVPNLDCSFENKQASEFHRRSASVPWPGARPLISAVVNSSALVRPQVHWTRRVCKSHQGYKLRTDESEAKIWASASGIGARH